MMPTLYQMTRSLFSSETLTLFWDKTSELTREASGRIRLSDSDSDNLAHLRTAYLVVWAGGVSAGDCMFAVSGSIRVVLGARRAGEFGGINYLCFCVVTMGPACFPYFG